MLMLPALLWVRMRLMLLLLLLVAGLRRPTLAGCLVCLNTEVAHLCLHEEAPQMISVIRSFSGVGTSPAMLANAQSPRTHLYLTRYITKTCPVHLCP